MSFSPDGHFLAFDVPGSETSNHDIFVLSTDARRERIAVQHRANDLLAGWSEDGNHLLFTSDRSGSAGLYATPMLQGESHGVPLLLRSGLSGVLGVSASNAVYYLTGGRSRSEVDIRVGRLDLTTGEPVSAPGDLVTEPVRGAHEAPVYSPDGHDVAFVRRVAGMARMPETSIVIRPHKEGAAERVLPSPLHTLTGLTGWTPDGSALVASGVGFTGKVGVWRVDVRTGRISILFEAGTFLGWSLDGRSFYHAARLPAAAGEPVEFIIRMSDTTGRTGKDLMPITYPAHARDGFARLAALSPDRTKIYYRRFTPSQRGSEYASVIVEHDLRTGAERSLHRPRQSDVSGGINLSPDGRHIAIADFDSSRKLSQIVVIPLANQEPTVVMEEPDPAANVASLEVRAWAPNGKAVLVTKRAADRQVETWWVPIEGRPAKLLPADYDLRRGIAIHPDAQQIAFEVSRPVKSTPHELWVLENLLPAAPRR
jgi:Tol biopolymer transport system component